MIKTDLYRKTLYLNREIDYLINCEILEYDMRDAGFNLIKYFKLLPDKQIAYLEKMTKDARKIEIGMIQRKDKSLASKLTEAFIEARRMFFDANDISEDDVLSIKKDAIFIIRKKCQCTEFENIEFRIKNRYLGYFYINRVEMYYTNNDTPIDVKGIDDSVLHYHEDYMMDFIRDVFNHAIYIGRSNTIKLITDFINDYRSNNLDFGYYRNFDSESYYTIIAPGGDVVKVRDVEDESVFMDTTYNYFKFLVPIANIFI